MPTTNGNRKILDLKRPEQIAPCPSAGGAGVTIAPVRHVRHMALQFVSASLAHLYHADEDGWIIAPAPGTTAAGAGAAAVGHAWSTGSTVGAASLTATAGTTSTITTNQTLQRDLRGYSVHILAGPNAGSTLTISSNTTGANSVITVPTQGVAFSASTVYRLLTPRWYLFAGGTLGATSFRVFDWATNSVTSLSITGLPATFGTDARLVATPSWIDTGYRQFATGTATAGGASTIDRSTANWAANQWTNFQIRLTGGTGAGQIRTVASNTATQITVSSAWTTQPDATTTFSVEGNDDFLYLLGNNAVAMYRYSISGNTWTTLSPTAARAGAPGAALSAEWVEGVTASDWTAENSIINGRRIYSFRGGAGAVLDYYDIASNTWVSGVAYSPAVETFTTGSSYAYFGDRCYIAKDATNRWFAYDYARNEMVPWGTWLYPQGTAVVGNKAWVVPYVDGATVIPFVCSQLNSSVISQRQMVI